MILRTTVQRDGEGNLYFPRYSFSLTDKEARQLIRNLQAILQPAQAILPFPPSPKADSPLPEEKIVGPSPENRGSGV